MEKTWVLASRLDCSGVDLIVKEWSVVQWTGMLLSELVYAGADRIVREQTGVPGSRLNSE